MNDTTNKTSNGNSPEATETETDMDSETEAQTEAGKDKRRKPSSLKAAQTEIEKLYAIIDDLTQELKTATGTIQELERRGRESEKTYLHNLGKARKEITSLHNQIAEAKLPGAQKPDLSQGNHD